MSLMSRIEGLKHMVKTSDRAAVLLEEFVSEVNARSEAKMIKTGKLEGSHKAAIDEVMKEIINQRKEIC